MATSGRITGAADNGRYLYIDWSVSGTSFTAKLYLVGDLTGIANSGSHFTVDGTQYAISGSYDNWGTGTPLLLKTVTKTTSKSSIAMSGAFIYNGSSWTAVYVSGTATLGTKPSSPTNVTASGNFAVGDTMSITWNTSTGATGYKLYYAQRSENTWLDWNLIKTVTTNSATHIFATIGDSRTAVKFGVSATNSVGDSSIIGSNIIERISIKVWNGSAYIKGNAKVWNGSEWKTGTMKIWNGSAWVNPK
jgi:hypothetical protein